MIFLKKYISLNLRRLKLFDVIHTLDREKIAIEFLKHKDLIKDKKIFVQVNTGEELSKSGVSPKTEASRTGEQ